MLTIERINVLGFVNYAVFSEGEELVRFDTYCDAVAFVCTLQVIEV